MQIQKVLNNNVVVALDENGAETVLMGRGLGSAARPATRPVQPRLKSAFPCTPTSFPAVFSSLSRAFPCRIS